MPTKEKGERKRDLQLEKVLGEKEEERRRRKENEKTNWKEGMKR
jgi:hypothetical protein